MVEKSAEYHKAVEGKDKSVAGRAKLNGAEKSPVPGVAAQGERPRDQEPVKGRLSEAAGCIAGGMCRWCARVAAMQSK